MPRTKQSDALLSMNTPAINALYGRSVTSVKTNENDLQIDLDQEATRNETIFNDHIFSDNVPRSLRFDQTVLAKHASGIAKVHGLLQQVLYQPPAYMIRLFLQICIR